MTETAINTGLRIALEQVNAALRRHGIEPSGDYGADIERLAANSDRYLWLRDAATETQQNVWLAHLPEHQDAYADKKIDATRAAIGDSHE